MVCDNISNAPNVGSLFRISDAFNVEELIFCGDNIPLGKRIKRTSRSTEKYVNFRANTNIHQVLSDLKAAQHFIIALEITKCGIALDQLKFDTKKPIALIIGNENLGISDAVLQQCNVTTHITMYGNNSSMNVVQAASIALYEITNQLHL